LYSGRIGIFKPDNHSSKVAIDYISYEGPRWEVCYTLVDYLQDSSFKDAVIDCAVEIVKANARAWITLGPVIYKHWRFDSPDRKFAVVATAYDVPISQIKDLTKEPDDEELLGDLMLGFAKAQKEEPLANPMKEQVDMCM
jgi:hypothetical protein